MCSKPEGTVSFYIQLCLQLPVLRGTFHSFNIKLTFTKQRLSIFALGTDTCDICFCLICLQHVQIPHTHKKLCTACMWSCVIHWILKHDKQLNMHVIYFLSQRFWNLSEPEGKSADHEGHLVVNYETSSTPLCAILNMVLPLVATEIRNTVTLWHLLEINP